MPNTVPPPYPPADRPDEGEPASPASAPELFTWQQRHESWWLTAASVEVTWLTGTVALVLISAGVLGLVSATLSDVGAMLQGRLAYLGYAALALSLLCVLLIWRTWRAQSRAPGAEAQALAVASGERPLEGAVLGEVVAVRHADVPAVSWDIDRSSEKNAETLTVTSQPFLVAVGDADYLVATPHIEPGAPPPYTIHRGDQVHLFLGETRPVEAPSWAMPQRPAASYRDRKVEQVQASPTTPIRVLRAGRPRDRRVAVGARTRRRDAR